MITFNEELVRYLILGVIWIEFIWELYLSRRQYNVTKSTAEVPANLKGIMTAEEYSKAREYALAKTQFGFVKDIIAVLVTTVVISLNILAVVWNYAETINPLSDEISSSCLWLMLLSIASTIIDLPFSIYYTFVLEEKFGFNKQTVRFYVWDKIKAFILSQVLTAILSSIVIVVIKKGGDYFFIWLWAAVCGISLILLTIYPALIAPLFDKYTPLPEGTLRTKIEELAHSLHFPLTQLYVVEGSKRSSHSNAYFYGLFNSKRIVIFDTLLPKDADDDKKNEEILAVLSHELGHWAGNHTTKNLVVMQLNLLWLFYVFASLFKYPLIYKALGFVNIQPVLVGLFVVIQYVMMPYNTLLSFLITVLSRKFEFEADKFATNLGKGEHLENALLNLNKDNLGFPVHDWLYSAYYHSHPPLLQRINAIKDGVKEYDEKKKDK